MRGKFYMSQAEIDTMEARICSIQEAIDNASDLPMTGEMSKLFGEIETALRKLATLNEDRAEPVRPYDDRAAQALGWPERY